MDIESLKAETLLAGFIKKFIQEIEEYKKAIADDIDRWGDKIWTKIIKMALSSLGKDSRFEIYSHKDGGEYLLDLIWESRDKDNG